MECREAVFAAWLVNINRFYDEGADQLAERCSGLLEKYMDVKKLLGILQKNPEYKREWTVAKEAFELSLCESEVSEKLARGKNLTSVFSRVTVRDQVKLKKMYYPIAKESPDAVFPEEDAGDGERERLSEEFAEELLALKDDAPTTWEDFIVVFDGLLRKYTWCITASDYEGEDISLYNQSRIAGAIAECMLRSYDKDGNYFKLAVGDFSGIQNYVFSVANVNESGVAKRLRARSFYVDVAVSAIAQDIIYKFQLTQNHILMLTGGKFYLLLPNTNDSEQILNAIEREIEESFLSLFKGQIAIHLAWITIGADGLENYSRSITELMRVLGEKKTQAFYHSLTDSQGWMEDKFCLYDSLKGKHICSSCQRELTDAEGDREEQLKGEIEKALGLVEESYLGGSGSRGYGQVKFEGEWKEIGVR